MNPCCPDPKADPLFRLLAEQALSRAGGAPLVPGNNARILKDAEEHFSLFLDAIGTARRTVFLENYIFADDRVGREFSAALEESARRGVKVRVICDWLGSFRLRRSFWQPLLRAGGEVRWFNPPDVSSPLAWFTRDHRKILVTDGQVAFVTGLCISSKWLGDRERGVEPWRDTGIAIRGPAVADIEAAFGQTWAATGVALAQSELTPSEEIAEAGHVALRVLPAVPAVARLYRLDQLVAVMARYTLWLTDAYFVGVPPYVQALRSAAVDGVDVRLLVPGASDLRFLSAFSRSGYRPLLEAGVRVFEWNGSMLHAKTAVADGRWARIGSSNLNMASWMGNYELDVAVEDAPFANAMQDMYLADLERATEIVLGARHRIGSASEAPPRRRRPSAGGSMARAAAGALRIGNTVGSAIGNRRVLGRAESGVMVWAAVVLLVLAVVGIVWPLTLTVPLVMVALWMACGLLFRARALRKSNERSA